jgi:hypothetical protein
MSELKFHKFTSIEQFKNVIKDVRARAQYIGRDENNEAVFDMSAKAPKLRFKGTVKSHGTNHGIVLTKDGGFYTQSRERITTPESDNAGSSFWSHANKEHFIEKTKHLFENDCQNLVEAIVIYGEWCGGNIQAKVAINGLPKMFLIFSIKVVFIDGVIVSFDEEDFTDIADNISEGRDDIHNIEKFGKYEIEIDFENPEEAQNKLVELTLAVEKECPIGKYFGKIGIGEGIVWKADDTDEFNVEHLIFKVKGEEHAGSSKVKTLAPVDTVKLENIQNVVEYVTPAWRLEQAYNTVFDTVNGGTGDIKRFGELIKWTMSDIIKEESDTLLKNGVEPKEINSGVVKALKTYFEERTNNEAFGK